MKENKKNITSGDILEMMVRAGLKPASARQREREDDDSADENRNPIISIHGKDVQWRELEKPKRNRAA
jgi:hypothetical protein